MTTLAFIKSELFYVVTNETTIRGPFSKECRVDGYVTVRAQPGGKRSHFGERTLAFEHWSEAAEHVAVEFEGQAERAAASARNLRTLAKLHGPRAV